MEHQRILITGSSGLVGTAIRHALHLAGCETAGLDIRGAGPDKGDIRDRSDVRRALKGCTGIVHLAAISRVVWAEREPDICWATNVGGLEILLSETKRPRARPWMVFSSSREVYGHVTDVPVVEEAPLCPVNTYGQSKAEGEVMMAAAANGGLRSVVVRLSNVYGSTTDHPDRVIPAFAKAAATGGRIKIEGGSNAFDFTHLSDTVSGLMAMIARISRDKDFTPLAPIQFVTGEATTLQELAELALKLGGSNASVVQAPARSFDVSSFCGNPARAFAVLGWKAKVPLRVGFERLVDEFAELRRSTPLGGTLPSP